MEVRSNLVGTTGFYGVTLSASRLEETGTLSSVTCKAPSPLTDYQRQKAGKLTWSIRHYDGWYRKVLESSGRGSIGGGGRG